MDFSGWQYLSRAAGGDPTQVNRDKPVVYFGSFRICWGDRTTAIYLQLLYP